MNYENILSAFLGALFAFFFVRMGDFLKRISQRKQLYITSLVNIERNLNENYNLLFENEFKINAIIKQYNKAKEKGYSLFSGNKLNLIPFDNNSFNNLSNMGFYNDLLNYKGKVTKFNTDNENLFQAKELLKSSRLGNIINDELYMYNLGLLVAKFDDINVFNSLLEDITKELLAKARVLFKVDRSYLQKFYGYLIKKSYKKNFSILVNEELRKVEEETKNYTNKDKILLDSIFNKESKN